MRQHSYLLTTSKVALRRIPSPLLCRGEMDKDDARRQLAQSLDDDFQLLWLVLVRKVLKAVSVLPLDAQAGMGSRTHGLV